MSQETQGVAPGSEAPNSSADESAAGSQSPTPEAIPATAADIASLKAEIARVGSEATELGRRAQGTADRELRETRARLASMETQFEQLATQTMSEPESRAWKAERALERERAQTQAPAQQQAVSQFQSYAAQRLQEEGLKDADVDESFKKYAGSNSASWYAAIDRAIADRHKEAAAKAREEAKTSAEKAREDERAKLRNERRTQEPTIDTGRPAGNAGSGKAPSQMNEKEFNEFLTKQGYRPLGR